MASIHGLVYIIIGLFVSIVSYFSDLPFFIYIGIIFVIVGIIKLILLWKSKKRNTSNNIYNQKTPISRMQQNATQKQGNHLQHHAFVRSYYCPRCGLKLTQNFNFCPRCGLKLN